MVASPWFFCANWGEGTIVNIWKISLAWLILNHLGSEYELPRFASMSTKPDEICKEQKSFSTLRFLAFRYACQYSCLIFKFYIRNLYA